MSELTFETVNQEIESLDLEDLESEINAEALDAASVICKVWKKIGNILRLIAKIRLLPKKWRNALKLLINSLDALCG